MDDTFPPLPGADIRETAMKTIYILLTRSGTLLSNLVYRLTGARYTHASIAFDEDLSCLYSSTRKNGYTMFPAGPSREYLDRGVFRLRPDVPCALYALEVSEEAYTRARRRADHMMAHGNLYRFNVLGADPVRAAHPLAAASALFLLAVRRRGAGKERGTGAAQAQHPDAPQRLHHPAGPALRVRGAAVRPAAAPEHGLWRGRNGGQCLPWAGTGPCEGRRAADLLKKVEIGC